MNEMIYQRNDVSYNNDFNNLPLKGFTTLEKDILMAVITLVRGNGQTTMVLDCRKIAGMIESKPNVGRVKEGFESIREKLKELNYKTINTAFYEGEIYLFSSFGKNKTDGNKWIVGVTEWAEYLFNYNPSDGKYTNFPLPEFVSLSSKYSKTLYQHLKQWKNTGKYIVMLDQFREEYDIPDNFTTGKIDERVINPSIKELSPMYFTNLKCKKIYDETTKKGRPPVIGYCFTFKKQEDTNTTDIICPLCEQPLIYKELKPDEWAWCHKDGKKPGARCSVIWNSMEDIRNARKEKRMREEAPVNLTEEQKENKRKLADMAANLIKTPEYLTED